jgi:hypothetical protein
VTDATAAINADHSYAKAYQRRAASLFAIGGIEELNSAIRDLEKVADMVDGDAHDDVQREVSSRLFTNDILHIGVIVPGSCGLGALLTLTQPHTQQCSIGRALLAVHSLSLACA